MSEKDDDFMSVDEDATEDDMTEQDKDLPEQILKPVKKKITLCDGVKEYIEALPSYEPWKMSSLLIQQPGNYLLPVEVSRFQWYYLSKLSRYFTTSSRNFSIDSRIFKEMPGVELARFQTANFKWQGLKHSYRMADIAHCFMDGTEGELVSRLVFLPSLSGAIAALFFSTKFHYYVRYWHALYGCDHQFILHESDSLSKRTENDRIYKPYEFGQPYSDLVPIPWGFRLEVKSAEEYTIRCLGDSMTSGLCDLHVTVRNGQVNAEDISSLLIYSDRRMWY